MELLLFMSTLVYRYDFKLANPEQKQLDVVEGFLRKVNTVEV
jgi:benzoate 4-monooxygenase